MRQTLRVFVRVRHFLHLNQDVNELGHDPGEACDSADQDEGDNDAFNLTLRVEVAETHGSERREDVVDNDDEVLTVGVVRQLILVVERKLVWIVRRVHREEVPERADKVGQDSDEDDQAEHLEPLDQEDLQHDVVVVNCMVIFLINLVSAPLGLNDAFEFPLVVRSNH